MSRKVAVPQKVDVWASRFDKYCDVYNAEHGEGVLAAVCEFLIPNTDGNFQSQAYARFEIVGVDLFFSVRAFQLGAADLSGDEFRAALCLFAFYGLCDKRATGRVVSKGGRRRFVPDGGAQSVADFFVERFAVWRRDRGLRPFGDKAVLRALRAWVVNQCVGVVGEREAFDALVEAFGRGRVRWASKREEREDVDCYVNGQPISCKSYNAWNRITVERYRYGSKKLDRPVAYVNQDGRALVSRSRGDVRELSPVEFRELVGVSS